MSTLNFLVPATTYSGTLISCGSLLFISETWDLGRGCFLAVFLQSYLCKASILVCSGCCNKTQQTRWFRDKGNLFLLFLELGKSKIKVLTDQVSAEGCYLVHRVLLFPLQTHGRKDKECLSGHLYKGIYPFMKALSL